MVIDSGENVSGLVWGAGLAVGYALVLWGNPCHAAFRDGLRCVMRYTVIARTFAALGFLFAVSEEVFHYASRLPSTEESAEGFAWWGGWNPPVLRECLLPALLPSFDGLTGIFNCMITGYPMTVAAAFLFWINYGGVFGILLDALRRRYSILGLILMLMLLVSSICAALKPIAYLTYETVLQKLPFAATVQVIEFIRHAAFLFEHTFAVYVQVVLITVAYVWVRGITYDGLAIREFALRRLGVVMRWALPIYLISVLILELPFILPEVAPPWTEESGRLILGFILLVFPAVQIRLIFHNRNVREAMKEQGNFWRKNGFRFFWFALVSVLTFYGLAIVDRFVFLALGPETAAGIAWNVFYPFLWAPFGAWMLASWVCLFKQTEKSKPGVDEWVAF